MVLFDRLNLSTRFLLAAAFVLSLSMAALGALINHQITRSVLATSGADAATFMRAFFEPAVQRMRDDGTLPADAHQELDSFLIGTPIVRTMVSVKLWNFDGTVIYSSMSKDVVGQTFVSTDVEKAASGQIVSEFQDMVSAESAYEQSLDKFLIEIYAPLYRSGTDEIIAVGEIYEDGTILAEQLYSSQQLTWLVVGLTTAIILLILYLIVHGGSRTIAAQRTELQRRMFQAQEMAKANESLRLVAQRASGELAEANENYLRHLGAELHDGPAQLITLATLKIEHIRRARSPEERNVELKLMEEVLTNTQRDIRVLSSGLMLPEIERLPLHELIKRAVHIHVQRTGTTVNYECHVQCDLSHAAKICIFRFVQEGLNNSFRHARGVGQRVSCKFVDQVLTVLVEDSGSGARSDAGTKYEGIGLKGLRLRVESLGGSFVVNKRASGTVIQMRLKVLEA